MQEIIKTRLTAINKSTRIFSLKYFAIKMLIYFLHILYKMLLFCFLLTHPIFMNNIF